MTTKKLMVVGMDPSLSNWGLVRAVLDLESMRLKIIDMELVKTEPDAKRKVRKNCEDLDRAQLLHAGMVRACADTALAFVEVPVGSQSARAMASYGVCVGVLSSCPVPLIPVLPEEVKLAAVGHRQAAKAEMIAWATELHPEAPWNVRKVKGAITYTNDNEHLADALASIYAGLLTDQFKQARAMMGRMLSLA